MGEGHYFFRTFHHSVTNKKMSDISLRTWVGNLFFTFDVFNFYLPLMYLLYCRNKEDCRIFSNNFRRLPNWPNLRLDLLRYICDGSRYCIMSHYQVFRTGPELFWSMLFETRSKSSPIGSRAGPNLYWPLFDPNTSMNNLLMYKTWNRGLLS